MTKNQAKQFAELVAALLVDGAEWDMRSGDCCTFSEQVRVASHGRTPAL